MCKIPSTPGLEPGIFRSVGGRVIHCATRPMYTWILHSSMLMLNNVLQF